MAEKISAPKRGNRLGFWFFKVFLKLLGLKGAYGLLYFVCLYYLIFDRKAVSLSMAYINKRYKNENIFVKIFYVYMLFVNQGKNLIDRYYIISGQGQFDIKVEGYDKIKDLLSNPQEGVILLTAHVGNWQISMTVLENIKKKIYLVMRPEDNDAVKESLNIDDTQEKIVIVSPEKYTVGAIELVKAIGEGDIVSIMGDRAYGFKSMEVSFLGAKASFPYGAFVIGAAVGCSVVVMLSAKISDNEYLVSFSDVIRPCYHSRKKKNEAIKGWVQEFAGILEDYVAKYPLQWFVFQDIWQ
jgi:predicted LPLAT superfamily acyltransferase